MTAAPPQWIESTSWELPFFGLPNRIPWPAEVDSALASKEPFEVEHLLNAIEALGPEAGEPWTNFLRASERLEELSEALEDTEIVHARELLEEFERLHPGTAFVTFHLGSVARLEGNNEEAARLYKEAADKAPKVAAVWTNLGIVHSLRGQRDEAIEAFKKALEISPRDRTTLEGLANLRALVKLRRDPNNAEDVMFVDVPTFGKMAADQLNKMANDPEGLLNYGEQLLRDGLLPQLGYEAINRAYALQPSRRATFSLTSTLRLGGQLEPARATISKYIEQHPEDAEAYFHLAQVSNAMGKTEDEQQALDRLLAIDPNAQTPLGIRFGLGSGEHDPAKEQALLRFGEERNSYMAFLIASDIARRRGDTAHAVQWAERAFAIEPEREDVLLHYTTVLGEARNFEKLVGVIKPKIESGKFSKRLDWNYAQVLQQLGLNSDALNVLREALKSDVPADFRAAAEITIDAWTRVLAGAGVPLEVHKTGHLQRPVLLTLPDGDGGIVLKAGAPLPAGGTFPWRAASSEVRVALQQGQTGGTVEPRPLGTFLVRGIQPVVGKPTTIDCQLTANPDGALHFRALQNGRKLEVGWAPLGIKS